MKRLPASPYGDVRAGSRAKGQNPSRTDGNRGRLTACASAPTKIVTYGPWNLSWSRPGYGSHEPINLREATIAVSQAELSQLDGAIEDPGSVPNVTATRPSRRQAVDPDTLRLTLEALREFTTNHFPDHRLRELDRADEAPVDHPQDMLDPELDMEADLGVDTVKLAEIFAVIRDTYGIQRDEALKLRGFPTINHVIGFVMDRAAVDGKLRGTSVVPPV